MRLPQVERSHYGRAHLQPPVLGALASIMGRNSRATGLRPFILPIVHGIFSDRGFALVHAYRIEFSMDCFPEKPHCSIPNS
jgi:hypothetical protein